MRLQKEMPGVDVPILRERLHYSFIWGKIPLMGIEDNKHFDIRAIDNIKATKMPDKMSNSDRSKIKENYDDIQDDQSFKMSDVRSVSIDKHRKKAVLSEAPTPPEHF